jgi:hypothetical protein
MAIEIKILIEFSMLLKVDQAGDDDTETCQ